MTRLLKRIQERLLNLQPVSGMSPDNLYAFLDALYQKRNVNGPILEVGCASGGTTAIAYTFLARIGKTREYYCIDTFSGFVKQHLQTDLALGLPYSHIKYFSNSSKEAVKKRLCKWGVSKHIHLIQVDITNIDTSLIPDNISVCLLDVDLRDPTYEGLNKIYPKLADDGVILVDDCKEGTSWVGANIGYTEFMQYNRIELRYFMGMGVIEKERKRDRSLNWNYGNKPNKIIGSFYSSNNQI